MDKYENLLKTWHGELEDLCLVLYDMLMSEEEIERIIYFQEICEKISYLESDESEPIDAYFEEDEVEQISDLYGKYIDEVINSVRKKVTYQKLSESEFYKLLWDLVMNNQILVTKKEKAFGLLWILADDGIPYYNVGEPLSMSDEEYRAVVNSEQVAIDKIRYILSVPFEQKTEVSSLILRILLEYKDYRIQSVLLSQVMDIYLKKEFGNLKRFIEMFPREKTE